MTRGNIVNFVLFQLTWFSCVLGAANDLIWPGAVSFGGMVAWHLGPGNQAHGDWGLLLVAALLGLILDSLWIQLGIVTYETPLPSARLAPLWILLLWMSLALTLNHSLSWLLQKPGLAGALSAVASPVSYYAGERIGALTIHVDMWKATLILGLAWAACIPLLLRLARSMVKSELREFPAGR
jgi:Protein of unknown function (DUF2878)